MKRTLLGVLATLLPILAHGQGKPQPSPTPASTAAAPSFPAGVEQVIVDTVVTDKKGNPLTDLKKGDFTVLEDGSAQEIVSFEAVQIPDPPAGAAAPPARPAISTNGLPEDRTGRTFVIVFDDIQMTNFQATSAKAAVAQFLKTGVREGDRVSLVATSGGAWWSTRMQAGRDELISLLKRLEGRMVLDNSPDRMSDYEAMRIQAYNDSDVMGRVQRRFESLGVLQKSGTDSQSSNDSLADPEVRMRATEVYFKAVTRNRITLQVMKRVLESLIGSKGRKSVILVSQGFISDPNLDEFKEVVQASRRGNAAVYFVDTRGLGGLQPLYSAEFGSLGDPHDFGGALLDNIEAAEGSESIADDTGGFTVKNSNDLAAGIQKIARETRVYYLLGYNPSNAKQDGRFRKIEVKVARKGIEIRARKGYYAPLEGKAPPPPKPGENDPVIQRALDSPFELDDIPIRMTAYTFDETLLGKLNAVVATDVDVKNFSFQEQDGRLLDALEFLMVVAHRDSGEFFQYNQKVEMKLLPATRERLLKTWYSIPLRDFELGPGGYQAKIVVRDKNSGRVGSVVHEFEVPDPAAFRTSSLTLSDTLEAKQVGDQGPQGPRLLARRDFAANAMLYCQFAVYGADKDKTTGMPKVSAGFEIVASDGTVKTRVNPSVINPTSLGKLVRMVGTSLDEFEPGAYAFDLKLKDELSGKTLEVREPFSVVAAAPPAAGASGGSSTP